MKNSIWLLGSLGAVLALSSAASAGDKPQDSKWQALPHFLQISEIAVAAENTPQCPCCELLKPALQSCEAPLWFVASKWLKPLALGCQVAPFLGYVDFDIEIQEDPQVILSQFLRSVMQQECVPASCDAVAGCTACTACAECKCATGMKCVCPVGACKCAIGKCCAEGCTCKDCNCTKSCVCPAAKAGCPWIQTLHGKRPLCPCCENCPCASGPTAVWMWVRQPMPPMPPPAFGMHWGPMPCPGFEMPPPIAHMSPMPHGPMTPSLHPLAQWQMHQHYPRILPPVVEEHSDVPHASSVAQAPEVQPGTQFHPVSRAVRRPTQPTRPTLTPVTTQAPTGGTRVQYSTSCFEATCDRLSYLGNVVVLQGNVQLVLCNNPQGGRVCAEWIEVNTETGAFSVNGQGSMVQNAPAAASGVVPTSCKPDFTCPPTTRPVQR